MTNEELVALIQSGVNVEKNMTDLYEQNRNFIYKIALPYSKACDMDDLLQEAYFGLDKAVSGYDPEKEFMFMTYAEHWIRQAIQRYYYNCGRIRRFPVHMMARISKYHSFKNTYRSVYGNDPTEGELLKGLNISKKQLATLEKCIYEFECQSIDNIIPGTDNMTFGDAVADEYDLEDDVTERIGAEQCNAALWQCVDELDDRQSNVIKCHHKKNMTLGDISKQEGVSSERIRQIERKAFIILKNKNKVNEIASFYGYGCRQAYHYSVNKFKNTRTSSTESIAIKHLEMGQRLAAVDEMMTWV